MPPMRKAVRGPTIPNRMGRVRTMWHKTKKDDAIPNDGKLNDNETGSSQRAQILSAQKGSINQWDSC